LIVVEEVVIVEVVEAYQYRMSPCTFLLNEYNGEALFQMSGVSIAVSI
jgi:hypothetical protein